MLAFLPTLWRRSYEPRQLPTLIFSTSKHTDWLTARPFLRAICDPHAQDRRQDVGKRDWEHALHRQSALGQSFLSRFKSWSMDNQGRALILN